MFEKVEVKVNRGKLDRQLSFFTASFLLASGSTPGLVPQTNPSECAPRAGSHLLNRT